MTTTLVTGGLGMIGAQAALALVDLGHDVVVTAHRRTAAPSFLDGRVAVERVDVADRAAVLALGERYRIDDIVHLAGSVPGEDPVAFFRADLAALLTMLDAARAWQVRRFLVASSLGSYLGCAEVPWHEDLALPAAAAPHPIIAFKKAVEPLTTNGLLGSGVQPVVLRIGSTWGPLMDPETPFNPVPPLVGAVLRGESCGPLHAEDGGDFCYAVDAGRAIALLVAADKLDHDTYNVSGGRPSTNRELVAALRETVRGANVTLLAGRRDGTDACDPYLDVSRLIAATGFAPAFDVPAAVADYVAWRTTHHR